MNEIGSLMLIDLNHNDRNHRDHNHHHLNNTVANIDRHHTPLSLLSGSSAAVAEPSSNHSVHHHHLHHHQHRPSNHVQSSATNSNLTRKYSKSSSHLLFANSNQSQPPKISILNGNGTKSTTATNEEGCFPDDVHDDLSNLHCNGDDIVRASSSKHIAATVFNGNNSEKDTVNFYDQNRNVTSVSLNNNNSATNLCTDRFGPAKIITIDPSQAINSGCSTTASIKTPAPSSFTSSSSSAAVSSDQKIHRSPFHQQQRPASSSISSSSSASSSVAGPFSSATSVPYHPPQPKEPEPVTTSSESNSGAESNTYSDLLRYRSQEFYTKLNKTNVHGPSEPEPISNTKSSNANGQYNSLSRVNHNLHINENSSGRGYSVSRITKEFESLRDLTQLPSTPSYQATVSRQQNGLSNGNHSPNQRFHQGQTGHHPHYLNHLNFHNHNGSSSSLLRSNSSLSLSYYQKNGLGRYLGLQPHTVQYPQQPSQLVPTLSTSNLTSMTNGHYPGTVPSHIATVDRRLSSNYHSSQRSNNCNVSTLPLKSVMNCTNGGNAPVSTAKIAVANSSNGSESTAKIAPLPPPAPAVNGPINSNRNSLIATGTGTEPRPMLTRSTSSGLDATASGGAASATPLRPVPIHLYNAAVSGSGTAQPLPHHPPVYGHPQHYSQHYHQLHHQHYQAQPPPSASAMMSQMNSRSSTSLANNNEQQRVNNAATAGVIVEYNNTNANVIGSSVGGATTYDSNPYGTKSSPNIKPGTNTVVSSSATHRLTQRFPITAPPTAASPTKNPASAGANVVKLISSANVVPVVLGQTKGTGAATGSGATYHYGELSTSTATTTYTTATTSMAASVTNNHLHHHQQHPQQHHPPIINSLSRSFFNSGNIFESKKNKLFGSVSSIDLQCLKESQKVSVIERKASSKGGRSLKATNSTSGTASSFFKLFTSSSKPKIPSFGFSGTSTGPVSTSTVSNCGISLISNNVAATTTTTVHGSGSGSTLSSDSSINTVTVRADSLLSNLAESDSQPLNTLNGCDGQYGINKRLNGDVSQRLSIKSISVDSASALPANLVNNLVIDPVMPANEVLFRKYFTFYDLLSSTNIHRLFLDNSATLNGPSSSLLELNQRSTSTAINGNDHRPVTTFESSTLSSTSSYSSCTSSMSSSSHYNSYSSTKPNATTSQFPIPASNSDIGNELLAPSPNFLNEIGSERQYSIELTWNNGFKEEIPSQMLNQQQHGTSNCDSVPNGGTSQALYRSTSTESTTGAKCDSKQLHPPAFSKRINIFSDASPFAAFSQHSVMSDLYGNTENGGGGSSSNFSTLNHNSSSNKKLDIDFNDLDDGFGSLSSGSLSSTYPIISNGPLSSMRCPFSSAAETCNVLEMDFGTNYYRTHFREFEHQNWLQIHEKYGPIIVSIRKERVKNSSCSSSQSSNSSSSSNSNLSVRWRVIVRTTSLIPLRGTISVLPTICMPGGVPGSGSLDSTSSRRSSSSDSFNINSVKDVLTLVVPKGVNVSNFRLGSPTVASQLLKLDEMSQNTEYKIGVLYAYGNQHSEEEFYNNILDYSTSSRSPFYDFLNLIAQRVRLKEFKGYKAGLDVLNDTTGEYSWTAKFGHTEIMFHVCTELPFNNTNRQQLPRKRHIGNDIVTIMFLHENFSGSPFTPALIRSKFQQVFIIVKPIQNGKYFRVAVARHKLVPLFGPPLKPYYTRHELRDFILTKIINAENACHSVNKFAEMAKRTRHEYLTEMCQKHTTTQTVHHIDSSLSSNSLQSFKKLLTLSTTGSSNNDTSKRNKDGEQNGQLPYAGHILNGIKDPPTLNGAILFSERCAGSSVPSRLYVHDYSANRDVEVSLLLSNEAILVIESATMEVIWAAPVTSIIGWTDSRGVFATSSNCVSAIHDKPGVHKFGDKKSKSVDSEPINSKNSSRELRLYYHQGECIQIMQRPIINVIGGQSESMLNGKSSKQQSNQRNNDPFLMLIRVLELITRKSELRAIVIKRKSKATKSVTNTPEHSKLSSVSMEQSGCCGADFGFSMRMSTGIVEEIYDQTLSDYHLVPGCKVIEIDKISFAAMAMDELTELVNSSLIMCLTFTGFDYSRYPRCNCPWPKALQLQHKQKNQQTPPSDYENVSKSVSNTPIKCIQQPTSGVKTIHITHNAQPHPENQNQNVHQAMMNVSSPSSNSSYYSTNTASSNQSPSHNFTLTNQLYTTKSASSLSQLYQQSPIKVANNSLSVTSSPANTNRIRNPSITTPTNGPIVTQPSSLKDNLIRLITMDDYNSTSPNSKNDLNGTASVNDGLEKEKSNHNSKSSNYYSYYPSRSQPVGQHNPHRYTHTGADENYSSYNGPRFSNGNITQYSSLNRNGTGSTTASGTQVHLTSSTNSNATPVISGQMVRTGPYGKEASCNSNSTTNVIPVENNDCYLLTAQPVRVEGNTNAASGNPGTGGQPNEEVSVITSPIMTTYDSISNNQNNLYASLLSGSIHSDPVGDIVWPSMHSSLDHSPAAFLQNPGKYYNNTESSSHSTNTPTHSNCDNTSNSSNNNVAAQHLTEEVRKLSLEKDVLNDTISKLREENQRLHMESQTASQQLRKLTEWFFNTNPGTATNQSTKSSPQKGSTQSQDNTTTISIQQPQPSSSASSLSSSEHLTGQ